MRNNQIDPLFLAKRRETIREGLTEGIRREVERLRKAGLPLAVADETGKVVDIPPEEANSDMSCGEGQSSDEPIG
jgi:hypothetical protein